MDTDKTKANSILNILTIWIIIITTLLIGWFIGSGNLDYFIKFVLPSPVCPVSPPIYLYENKENLSEDIDLDC